MKQWIAALAFAGVMMCAHARAEAGAAPAPDPADTTDVLVGCYARTDVLRYNRFNLQLRPDGTWYGELDGDITLWGSATGKWRVERDALLLLPDSAEGSPLPSRMDIERRRTRVTGLRAPKAWEGDRFEPLEPQSCDDIGWAGTSFDRPGAPQPIADGDYAFELRSEEHPDLPPVSVRATIRGRDVVITNDASPLWPRGVLGGGRLLWNGRKGKWILARDADDANATEIGGCTDGPEVVDLEQRIYWKC
jgi:hypothetical protein